MNADPRLLLTAPARPDPRTEHRERQSLKKAGSVYLTQIKLIVVMAKKLAILDWLPQRTLEAESYISASVALREDHRGCDPDFMRTGM
jgi:hypothetical protein